MNKVFVYWNLHRNLWSVKDLVTGRVIMRTTKLTLENATFKVSEAGRQRVLREKRKNVHAGVTGYIVAAGIQVAKDNNNEEIVTSQAVTYNPYNGPDFVFRNSGDVIKTAKYVQFDSSRKVTV